MKIYSKFFLVALLLLPVSALAVSMTEDVTLTLPSTGESYTLDSTSSFNSLTIDNADFSFSLSTDQIVTLSSSDKRVLNNNQGASSLCFTSLSKVNLTATTTETFTVTPDSSVCTGGGGGGGGGVTTIPTPTPAPVFSSGGSGSTTPAPTTTTPTPTPSSTSILIQQFQAQIAALTAQLDALKGGPALLLPTQAPPKAKFVRNLVVGSKGNDVLQLQAFLAKDKSIYPEGLVTGFFGNATFEALKRFQKKYGIDQLGNTGPKTRAQLNKLISL